MTRTDMDEMGMIGQDGAEMDTVITVTAATDTVETGTIVMVTTAMITIDIYGITATAEKSDCYG